MNKILLGIGALVLGLAFAGEANAKSVYYPPTRTPYGRTYFGSTPYHLRNGVKYGGGYYYGRGKHYHWSHRTWSPVARRYHYYDPYLRVYYSYCPVTHRWLPVRQVVPVGPFGPIGVIR